MSIVYKKLEIDTLIIAPGIKFLIVWVLLGAVQWGILSFYSDRAYQWGLVNIVGSFIGSFLVILISLLIYLKFIFTFSPIFGRDTQPSQKDIDTSKKLTSILSVIAGICFGLYQSFIFVGTFSYIHCCVALLNGVAWLVIAIPEITSENTINFLKSNIFICSITIALFGAIYGYLQKLFIIYFLSTNF